ASACSRVRPSRCATSATSSDAHEYISSRDIIQTPNIEMLPGVLSPRALRLSILFSTVDGSSEFGSSGVRYMPIHGGYHIANVRSSPLAPLHPRTPTTSPP